MDTVKNIAGKIFFGLCLLSSSSAAMAGKFDADGILEKFNKRTFIENNDVINWAAAIDNLVGTYIMKDDANIILTGSRVNKNSQSIMVDLKDRKVFHELVTSSTTIDASFVNFFKFSRDKKILDEVTISDVITVTDRNVDLSTCVKNHPAEFSSTTKYWCISAITLSKVSTNKYKKTKSLAEGSYGIASGGATFQNESGSTAATFTASVSLIGPFVNGSLFESSNKDSGTPLVDKSFDIIKPTGLEGMILKYSTPK